MLKDTMKSVNTFITSRKKCEKGMKEDSAEEYVRHAGFKVVLSWLDYQILSIEAYISYLVN